MMNTVLAQLGTTMHTAHGAAQSTAWWAGDQLRAVMPGLGIPDKGFQAPNEVKQEVGNAVAFARWTGAAFLVVGLVMIAVQWGASRRAQRGDGGEENAVALGWWIAGSILLGTLFSVAGWFL